MRVRFLRRAKLNVLPHHGACGLAFGEAEFLEFAKQSTGSRASAIMELARRWHVGWGHPCGREFDDLVCNGLGTEVRF